MYDRLAKICLAIGLSLGILEVVGFIVFFKLIKKWENKRVEEVESYLNNILRLLEIGIIISTIFGIIGIILRE